MTPGEARTDEQKALDAEVLARVKRGIAFAKERYGADFANHIDPVTFNIRDGATCVLGQLGPGGGGGSYWKAVRNLGLLGDPGNAEDPAYAAHYGFQTAGDRWRFDSEMDALQRAWLEAIVDLRTAA